MKIGLFSPYLPKHFGGGEKHLLTTAWYLSQTHEVTLLLPKVNDEARAALKNYERLFNLDLSKVKLIASPLAAGKNSALQNWQETKKYNAFWYLTDGSVFFCGSPRGVLHIQVPYPNHLSDLISRWKLRTWKVKNANSQFTRAVIEKNWKTTIPFIHYPFADTENIHFLRDIPLDKNIISVGRFMDPEHTNLQAKRQDVLVDAFRQGCERFGWAKAGVELHLVGAIEPDPVHPKFVEKLKKAAKGYPIYFHHEISHRQLERLYSQSRWFWHAAGYEIDDQVEPQRVEHFGMTTIEAMAHGCIPLVPNRGGLKETVDDQENGFYYETVDDLVRETEAALHFTKVDEKKLRSAARAKAEQFSLQHFCQTIDRMLEV